MHLAYGGQTLPAETNRRERYPLSCQLRKDHSSSFTSPVDHPMDYSSDEYTSANLICASLRHRSAWASTTCQLLQSDGRRWRGTARTRNHVRLATDSITEADLGTHDVALSIPDTQLESPEVLRLLLLSPEDMERPQTFARLQHLYQLDKGRNVAVVFLLTQVGAQSAMQPFMELHIK